MCSSFCPMLHLLHFAKCRKFCLYLHFYTSTLLHLAICRHFCIVSTRLHVYMSTLCKKVRRVDGWRLLRIVGRLLAASASPIDVLIRPRGRSKQPPYEATDVEQNFCRGQSRACPCPSGLACERSPVPTNRFVRPFLHVYMRNR
jgi:hypothetical protein